MIEITVDLGPRRYPIHVAHGAARLIPELLSTVSGRRIILVSSSRIWALHGARVEKALRRLGPLERVLIRDGERHKSRATLGRLHDAFLDLGLRRDGVVVALGGGVVGDVAGFAAATYMRGVDVVQVPTTLLAMVDSSIGGKTAINHARGKNMIGAFHQPLAVIADLATLDTLPDREMRAGLAEVIKHGAALDAPFFGWLEQNVDTLLTRDRDALAYAVRRSCELKAAIVAQDERESGVRAVLNFGHTFGHAIETATGFGPWLHGEAVAAGMVMASGLSARAGYLAKADAARIEALIKRAGLPTHAPRLAPELWRDLMSVDKKAAGARVRFVLLHGLGHAKLESAVDPRLIDETITATAAAAPQ